MSRLRTRRAHRWNAALSGVLLVLLLVFGNALAHDHLNLRHDFSEDGLHQMNPATRALLGELEDVLSVEAYVTGHAEHAVVQLAKRRLLDLLRELQGVSSGRMTVRVLDPNTSTEARLEAERLELAEVPIDGFQGTARVRQNVYMGLVLRYRGREEVLPWVLPQNLELLFTRSLRRLQRTRRVVVGVVSGECEGPRNRDGFQDVRDLLATQHEVRQLEGLPEGEPVPEDVRVLLVLAPRELHPRTLFEIEQFALRGGRVLLCADPATAEIQSNSVSPIAHGLEPLLEAWGVQLVDGVVFDSQCDVLELSRGDGGANELLDYPFWPSITPTGLSREHPATAQLPGAVLYWAGSFEYGAELQGLERAPLLTSSETSWMVPPTAQVMQDTDTLRAMEAELLVTAEPRSRALALSLEGALGSAFAGSGAPAARTVLSESRWREMQIEAEQNGEPPPERPWRGSEEDFLRSGEDASVLLFGDADWLRDGFFRTKPQNAMLLETLVDWLALEDELMTLRVRRPDPRTLVDLLAEAREELGLSNLGAEQATQAGSPEAQREARARRLAERRRWTYMGAASGGSLLAYLLLALGVRLARRPLSAREEAA